MLPNAPQCYPSPNIYFYWVSRFCKIENILVKHEDIECHNGWMLHHKPMRCHQPKFYEQVISIFANFITNCTNRRAVYPSGLQSQSNKKTILEVGRQIKFPNGVPMSRYSMLHYNAIIVDNIPICTTNWIINIFFPKLQVVIPTWTDRCACEESVELFHNQARSWLFMIQLLSSWFE